MGNKVHKRAVCLMSAFMIACTPVYAVKAASVDRVEGRNRYITSAELAKDTYSYSKYVILANGNEYRDAVSAAPLAKSLNAPILLTSGRNLESQVKDTIKKLNAETVYIIGGLKEVSSRTENSLRFSGVDTVRIYGKNRYDTNVKIANMVLNKTKVRTAVMVNGDSGYPDAVSAASIAANMGYSILFCSAKSVPVQIKNFINNNDLDVLAVGGRGAVSDAALKSVNGTRIAAGVNRFDTNLKLLNYFKSSLNYDKIYLASGGKDNKKGFADALAACAAASKTNSPVVLSGLGANEYQIDNADNFIRAHKKDSTVVKIVGGEAAVSRSVQTQLENVISINGQVDANSELPFNQKFFIIGSNAYSMDYFIKHQSKIDSDMKKGNGIVFYCYYDAGRNIIMNTNSQFTVSEKEVNRECGKTIHFYDLYNETAYVYNGHNYKRENVQDEGYNSIVKGDDIGGKMLIGITLKDIVKENIPNAEYFQVRSNPYIKYINGSNEIQCMLSRDEYNKFTTTVELLDENKNVIAEGKIDLTGYYSYSGKDYIINFNLVDDASDNAIGNIANGGMVLQHGDYLFYNNTGDGNKLYRKDLNGSFDRAISEDDARYINVYGNKVIYSSKKDNFSIKGVNFDGTEPYTITDAKATYINVCGSYIYYSNHSDGGKLYRIKIDNTDSGVKFGTPQKICSDDCEFINVVGGNIYYSNYSDGKKLYCINTDGSGRVKVSSDSAGYINVLGNYIYYVTDNGTVKKIRSDGNINSNDIIAQDAGCLNVMGRYAYYTDKKDNDNIYRINLDTDKIDKVCSSSADFINITGKFADFSGGSASLSGENIYYSKNAKLYSADLKNYVYNGISQGKAVTKPNYTLKVSKVYDGESNVEQIDLNRSQKYIDEKYLPKKVTAVMSDDTVRELVVIWNTEKPADSNGVRTYTGNVIGYNASAKYKLNRQSTGLTASQVQVVNNIDSSDYIKVTGLHSGDIIKVYKTSDTQGSIYGTALAGSDGTAEINLSYSSLDDEGGEVYVTITTASSSGSSGSSTTSSESKPVKVEYDAEPPKQPASISAYDNDSVISGIDGRDFKVKWSTPSEKVVKQYIYILKNITQNSEVDYNIHQPSAVIYDNRTTEWTGNYEITKDSAGYDLTGGSYRIFVIFEDAEGRRSTASKSTTMTAHAENEEGTTRVSKIDFKDSSILLEIGQVYTPDVIITPSDASDKNYTLLSYNDTIVKVENHSIRALAAGTTSLKVISDEGDKEDVVTITVNED